MSEARKHLYHLWQLAEELAVHAGQPLHAFLLLHHSLTQPPLALRHATTGVRGGPSPSSADAATPLHSIAWDAEWKAEELATRVRAAEYLLFPDVLVAAPSPAATATAAPRTLSRRAALESLELAEQVLAPVFAASSHSSGAPSAQASTAHRSGKADSLFSGEFDVEMAARGSGRDDRSGGSSHHGGSSAVGNARVSSMYFLNDNTVAALAWPLAAFTLTWPLTDQKPCGSASQPVFHFHAANQTIMVPVALVVRAHVLQSMVCYRRVQYRRALQCLHAARAWVTRQLVEAAAQERSLRLLWTDLVERQSRPPQLPPQPLPHFRPLMQRILVGERRACEALLSLEECRVHTMIVQSCGTLPPPPLLRTQDGVGSSGMAEDGGVAEPTLTHAPDLRLHYKQYQESVHQLHQQSRMYMEVLEWMAEEQEEEDGSKGNNNGGVEARSVRVKVEGEARKGSVADAGLPITALHSVRSQLSPFCLCALRRTTFSSSPSPAQSAQTSPFAARYNVRLAAEVLGWYHCLSHLYVLYQPPLPSTLTGANHGAARGTADSSAMEKEAAFLMRMTYKSKTASPPAPVASTAAPLHDAVQRALLHFRAYAAVFGSDSHDAEGGVVSPSPLPHEAALLLCLAEVAVADSYPFALHFCADTTNARGSAAGGSVGTAKAEASVAVTDVKLEEEESGESALGHRKRVRSTAAETAMHSQQAATTTRNSALPAVSAPPLSGHWVLPGVRAVLKLYIELTTVLMQAASTMHQSSVNASNSGSTPPPSPPLTAARLPNSALSAAAAAAAAAPSPYAPTPPPGAPAVPILQVGLPRAEQLLARLLFTIDREMLQLTGNAWSVGVVPAAAAPAAAEAASRPSQMARGPSRAGVSHPGLPSPTPTVESAEVSAAAAAWTDRLLSSSPAQLRWLVQIKSAALLTMARHHLTQLSLVRCAFYLREVQQFTRVFHRQARLSLAPETHVLLAAAATSMALRRLPAKEKNQRRSQGSSGTGGGGALAVSDDDINAGSVVTDDEEEDLADDDDDDGGWASGSAVYALAQGWPSPDATGAGSTFALTPEEEATVAQDVGLPYAHLLAAERAARTSLHTPPAFSLLVYLMKAWAVYQLVAAGEELTWAAPPPLHQHHHHHHHRHDHTVPQPQPQPGHGNPVTVSPLSPVCAPLPLPAASFATTTLNSTLADQQRRVARLDSLTSTPTTTPTLRSRHAAMPPEMQRIQLDGPGVLSPAISPVSVETAEVSVAAEGAARRDAPPHKEGAVKEAPRTAAATAVGAAFQSQRAATRDRLAASSSSTLTATAAPLPPTAHVTAISLTVRHRAGEVLQRMMAVLRHHYEAHVAANAAAASASLSSSPSGAASSVPAAAWTPQNITLFRLLRGAVLLSEDHDELAAALELKEATHYAKARLGVLHPFVADGLTLLTAAYASLDGEGSTAGSSHSSERAQGVAGDAAVQPDSAARTRRVAVQLAMRSSCAALASLSAAAAPSLTSQGVPGAVAGRATAEDTTRAAEAVASPDVLHARLQAWWSRQVLSEMCSNGSPHRSEHARRQLQALFDWLPGAPEYVF